VSVFEGDLYVVASERVVDGTSGSGDRVLLKMPVTGGPARAALADPARVIELLIGDGFLYPSGTELGQSSSSGVPSFRALKTWSSSATTAARCVRVPEWNETSTPSVSA
jgi:hypothetical protein